MKRIVIIISLFFIFSTVICAQLGFSTQTTSANQSINAWRAYMVNPELAGQYAPVCISQQVHRNIINAIYKDGMGMTMLNVVQLEFPPNAVSALKVVGAFPYNSFDLPMWLLNVDFANSDRGWLTKNGLFLRKNIITLWEIMGDKKMASLQLRANAYSASQNIKTSISKHNQKIHERSRASQQYGYYVSEMYSGNFVKAVDHYTEYEYHKKEAEKMEKQRNVINTQYPSFEMGKYEMSYQFRLDSSYPFSQTELQVINLISRSGYVPQKFWVEFRNSLNTEQKRQLGLR
ncbi:MAG: hypothetical protein B6I20_08665 [Bacteroidetes bacterium 4572_117]|nr:MAG: hypothetical protein B6I20_08665 [Bacteroidetes bacterium 4572_117]